MKFVIGGMKFDTDKMKNVAKVKKWYEIHNALISAMYPGKEVGREYICELWKSEKGNWLLTHEEDYTKNYGEKITEEEARGLLMRYATDKYEELYGELPEA